MIQTDTAARILLLILFALVPGVRAHECGPAHQRSRIIVGGDHNYPPYEYLDENGQPTGYNVELTRAVARQAGLDVEIRLGPWHEIRSALENGEIDAIHGMFYSAERDRTFDFSPAHTVINHTIIVRDGGFDPQTLEDLAGKKVLVMEGDIMHDVALANGLEDGLQVFPTQRAVLEHLSQGEGDCALVAELPARYWMKKMGWKNLRVSGRPFLSPEYCFAVRHGNEHLLEQLSNAMASLKTSGQYRKIHSKWLGIYKKEVLFATVARYVAIITSPIALLLIIVLIWTRTLKQQVAIKTQYLRNEVDINKKITAKLKSHQNALVSIARFPEEDPAPVMRVKTNGEILYMNPAARLLQKEWSVEKAALHPRLREALADEQSLAEIEEHGRSYSFSIVQIREQDYANLYGRDITEQKMLQENLRQSEKIRAIGKLAGGIAHDFNNQLSVILGCADLLHNRVSSELERKCATNIISSGQAAAALTRQLLAFARKAPTHKSLLNMKEVIETVVNMLHHCIDRKVEVRSILPREGPPVRGDAAALQNALLNLGINARDAMPNGGVLSYRLDTVYSDELPKSVELEPGTYARIEISDTGIGMDQRVLRQAFEPFFTTKPEGHGTGMGLSSALGTAEAHDGRLTLTSEPCRGTTVAVYLPICERMAENEPARVACPKTDVPKHARIVVIDDEELVRQTICEILHENGHHPQPFASYESALEHLPKINEEVDLILMDMVMPGMAADDAFDGLKRILPESRILLMSGNCSEQLVERLMAAGADDFLRKPVLPIALVEAIASTLTGQADRSQPPPC